MLTKRLKQLAHVGALWRTTAKKSEVAFSGHIQFPSGKTVKIQVYQNQYHTEGDTRPEFVIYADYGSLEAIEEGLAPNEYEPHPF